jgi:hypothetical protein
LLVAVPEVTWLDGHALSRTPIAAASFTWSPVLRSRRARGWPWTPTHAQGETGHQPAATCRLVERGFQRTADNCDGGWTGEGITGLVVFVANRSRVCFVWLSRRGPDCFFCAVLVPFLLSSLSSSSSRPPLRPSRASFRIPPSFLFSPSVRVFLCAAMGGDHDLTGIRKNVYIEGQTRGTQRTGVTTWIC